MSNVYRTLIACMAAVFVTGGCAAMHRPAPPPVSSSPPVIILPPIVTVPLTERNSPVFRGIPVLFADGSWVGLRAILKARRTLPGLAPEVQDRLDYDLALVDLRLQDPEAVREARMLFTRLDAFGKPYEIRESAGLFLKLMNEIHQGRVANADLRKKLDQVRKTFRDLSTLENSLK
jgi:hypothetical protein